ncbi:MAG: BRO-N domain-containing protein [Bacteroidales bacterium]
MYTKYLTAFKNNELGSVRVVMIEGKPFFVGKDVAEVLGYKRARKAILDHVDPRDKKVEQVEDAVGRYQDTVVINELGLYDLILSSKMPTAKKFKSWIIEEVLPSVKQTNECQCGCCNNDDEIIESLKADVREQQWTIVDYEAKIQWYEAKINWDEVRMRYLESMLEEHEEKSNIDENQLSFF